MRLIRLQLAVYNQRQSLTKVAQFGRSNTQNQGTIAHSFFVRLVVTMKAGVSHNCDQNRNIRILLTGGGSAGHVVPNIALIPELRKAGFSVSYIASLRGIENELLKPTGVPIFRIYTGKFRRYFSIRNLTDVFGVCAGFAQSLFTLRRIRPDVVFSKGGYVALPVVIAAWALRIPIIIHESDVSLGVANRISAKLARVVCITHKQTQSQIPHGKHVVLTGIPLRSQIFSGQKDKGLNMCGFNKEKPVLLILGGSLGSTNLNKIVKQTLHLLLKRFQVVHVTGTGKQVAAKLPDYRQFEYVNEIEHLYACADIVVSRAGATTVAEISSLNKRNILIPVASTVSRGDQLENASVYTKARLSRVIPEEQITSTILYRAITSLYENHATPQKTPIFINHRLAANKISELASSLV